MPDDKDDKTQYVRPPQPKLPSAPPPAPVPPPAAQAPPPTPAVFSHPAPAPVRADDDGATVFLKDVQQATATLQRVQPPGRSEIIRLSASQYKLGRADDCEIRLFTETASREHATLVKRQGAWYVQPVPGKFLIANGTRAKEEVALQHKMRLQLGDDELIFFDEAAARQPGTHVPTAPAAAPSNTMRLVIIAAVVVAAAGVLALLLIGG